MKYSHQKLKKQHEKLLRRANHVSPGMEGLVGFTVRRCGRQECAYHEDSPEHHVIYISWKVTEKNRLIAGAVLIESMKSYIFEVIT